MTEIVSVIIPAYNAASTIDRTLSSVRKQTWSALDIIVVDDGSRDDTAERVRAHCVKDSRVRLLVQPNAGVAVARNLAISKARGELIAPVDADDLWRADKISLQVQAMREGGARVGLVYCWYHLIDDQDHIIGSSDQFLDSGAVLERMSLGNLVGNGSAPLMRREAVLKAAGYDPGLRAANAQGCEDFKLYFQIAERYHFSAVPMYLVGYRWSKSNMSSDGAQMLRSYDIVIDEKRKLYPQFERSFLIGRRYFLSWLLERAIRHGSLSAAYGSYRQLRREWPEGASITARRAARMLVQRLLRGTPQGRKKFDLQPAVQSSDALRSRRS